MKRRVVSLIFLLVESEGCVCEERLLCPNMHERRARVKLENGAVVSHEIAQEGNTLYFFMS